MRASSAVLFSRRARLLAACCVGVSSVGAVGTCTAYYVAGTLSADAAYEHGSIEAGVPHVQSSHAAGPPLVKLAEADDPWSQALRSGAFWSKKGSDGSTERRSHKTSRTKEPASKRHREARPASRHQTTAAAHFVSIPKEWRTGRSSSTYRTVCVRLCDGFYWPISFAATASNLSRDSKACEESCNAPAALYYYPNPGGEPEDMINLKGGEPYTRLSKAFLYRTIYDANCKCRAHPWEQEALERHKQYTKDAQGGAAAESTPQ